MPASGSNAGRVAAFLFDAARRLAGALCSKATPRRLDQHGNSPSKERRECGTSRKEPRLRRSRLPCLLSLKDHSVALRMKIMAMMILGMMIMTLTMILISGVERGA